MHIENTVILFLMSLIYFNSDSVKITYLSVEHPSITYYNTKFLTYVNFTSRRYGRKNPVHYVGLHIQTAEMLNNSYNIDFFLYEWLTNVYKPSFVEFHHRLCDFIEKDQLLGAALRQGKLLKPCPHPPDAYHMDNMTANHAVIPPGFPFTRGRIYCNMTYSKKKERVLEGYIDMKLEQLNNKNAKNIFKS